MTYQDLKTLEQNNVIALNVATWEKSNEFSFRTIEVKVGANVLFFVERSGIESLRYNGYTSSMGTYRGAGNKFAANELNKLVKELISIEANESAAQAEETNQQENNVMRTMNNEKLTQVLTSAMSQSTFVAASKVAKVVGIGEYSIEWDKLADIIGSFIEEANNILPCDHQAESREMEKDLDNLFAETKERIYFLIEK